MTASRQYRSRLQPYRIAMLILYGQQSFVTWAGETATIRLGPLSRVFRVSRERVFDHLEWLLTNGYAITVEKKGRHEASVTFKRPPIWTKDQ